LVPLLLLLLLLLLQEFRRLDSSYGAARDRAQLLGGVETLPLLSVQVCVGGGGGQEEEGGGPGICVGHVQVVKGWCSHHLRTCLVSFEGGVG
jgi:hypothetical protein